MDADVRIDPDPLRRSAALLGRAVAELDPLPSLSPDAVAVLDRDPVGRDLLAALDRIAGGIGRSARELADLAATAVATSDAVLTADARAAAEIGRDHPW